MHEQPWLVHCPRCGERATVGAGRGRSPSRLVCTSCGLLRDGTASLAYDGTVSQTLGRRGPWRRDRTPRLHWPAPYCEAYALWLRETCCGGQVLWASNAAHLEYLRSYVAADLREGKRAPNKTLQHYLPAWLKDAKHRDEVLRALDRMAQRLPAGDGSSATLDDQP